MGSNESKPTGVSPTQQPSAPASACPVKHNQLPTAGAVEEASKGTCPISFFSNSSVNQEKSSCPVTGSSGQNQEQKSACPIKGNNGQKLEQSACPVKGNNGQTYKNPSVFNVRHFQEFCLFILITFTASLLLIDRCTVPK